MHDHDPSDYDIDQLKNKTTKAIVIRTYRRDTLTMYTQMFILCFNFVGLYFVKKVNKKYKVLTTFK